MSTQPTLTQSGSYDTTVVSKFNSSKTGRIRENGLLRITGNTAAPSNMCAEFCSVKDDNEKT
jgi:hypothetical protein